MCRIRDPEKITLEQDLGIKKHLNLRPLKNWDDTFLERPFDVPSLAVL
jgi:hypothetical protein